MPETVQQWVHALAENDGPGLLFEDRTWTWRETVGDAAARARVLAGWAEPGRPLHVGVLLENTPEMIRALLAGAVGAHVTVGINATRRGEALAANYSAASHGWTVAQRRAQVLATFKAKDPEAGLTEQEWVNGPATLQPFPVDAQAIERLRGLFFDADSDSDGRLDRAELAADPSYMPPGGWTKADRGGAITDLIAMVDYDHDQMVSFDETLFLVHEACAPEKVPTASVSVKKR